MLPHRDTCMAIGPRTTLLADWFNVSLLTYVPHILTQAMSPGFKMKTYFPTFFSVKKKIKGNSGASWRRERAGATLHTPEAR